MLGFNRKISRIYYNNQTYNVEKLDYRGATTYKKKANYAFSLMLPELVQNANAKLKNLKVYILNF